jgi:DNA-binding NarL/FixJ family response regulator
MGPDGPDLDLALRSAVDRGLIIAGPEGYSFRHALLAEAIYDDLLPGERTRWHQAYADVLSSGAADGTAAELARHAFAANDVTTALSAAIRAGDEAMTVGGPAEATAHYEMALGLLAQHATPTAPDLDGVEIALRANEAAIAAGTLHRALALVQDQVRQLPDDADPVKRASLLQAVASTALLDDTPLDALQCTTEALQLVPDAGPLRARVMATHARANRARAREDESRRWATAAADLARELNLPAVLADATTTLARLTPTHEPGWADQAEQSLRTSVMQARDGADVAAELRSSHGLGNLLYELGRLEEARDAYQRAADRAVRMRRPWAPYGLDGRSMAATVSYVLGEWAAVVRLADVSTEHPPMFARAMLGSVGLAVAAGRGETDALNLLPKLRSVWEREGLIAITCGAAAIDLYGDTGDIAAAVAVHDEVVDLVTRLWADPVFPARIRLSGLLMGQLASAARKATATERAELCERGALLRDAAVKAGSNAARRGPESQAWLARVDAEHVRLQWLCAGDGGERATPDELVQAWDACASAFDRFGHVFEAARSRARLAQALRIAGDPARAADEAARALEVAKTLGARPLMTELRSGAALASGPVDDRNHDLTGRELEVLELVAQGRSNRQIADQLYISAKTVSVHVSNILAKFEAGSRTEAVAVARRRGLLDGASSNGADAAV